MKSDVERRISEKDEEIENSRRNGQRLLESIQAQLDVEIRARSEAVRMKKKLEGEISDLEIQFAHANRQNLEAQKDSFNMLILMFEYGSFSYPKIR